MFENVKKVLDDFENSYNKVACSGLGDKEDEDTLIFFSMHLAKALMKDEYIRSEDVAKIILAAKGLSPEIEVKIK